MTLTLQKMWYRIWQVWRLKTRRLTDKQRGWICARLSPAQFALFAAQERGDQVHAYEVAYTLHQQGYPDDPLIIAALLHDCGKSPGVSLFHRTVIVILKRLAPRLLSHLRPTASGWLAPLARAWHHPALGAGLAAAVGASPDVVALSRYHQHPHPLIADPLLPLLQALQKIDNKS